MSNILHSPRLIDVDKRLLDGESQQCFYDALVSYLCTEVARQCSGVERHQVAAFIKGKLSGADLYYEGTYDDGYELEAESDWDPTPPDLYDLDVSLARGEKALTLRDIHFPVADERLGFDYTKLLKLFPSLHFLNRSGDLPDHQTLLRSGG